MERGLIGFVLCAVIVVVIIGMDMVEELAISHGEFSASLRVRRRSERYIIFIFGNGDFIGVLIGTHHLEDTDKQETIEDKEEPVERDIHFVGW